MSGFNLGFVLDFFRSQWFVSLPRPTKSFTGKTVIVTGSNTGLGLEAAKHFARLGAETLILAVRNTDKGDEAKKQIEQDTACGPNVIKVWQLDLSSYESVKQFAARCSKDLKRVDALVENAGVSTRTFCITEDNESTITTNVVSTFLLALLMLPQLKQTAQQFNTLPNLVIVSSEVHFVTAFPEHKAPEGKIFDELNNEATARQFDRYNVSKLLEVYSCREIAERTGTPSRYGKTRDAKPKAASTYPVTLNFVNPGLCVSELSREFNFLLVRAIFSLLARTTEQGSRTLVHAASAGPDTHGEYLSNCAVEAPAPIVALEEGSKIQKRVWQELSQKLEAIVPGVTKNI